MKPTAEDLVEMTARRCQYECKTMNSAEYERIKIIIASAIAAEREKERKRIEGIIISRKNLYAFAHDVTSDTIRIAYNQILNAIRAGDKQ